MNIFVDQIRQHLIKLEIQIDAIFYVIVWENEQIGRVQPAGFDEIPAELNADKVAKPDGRKSENGDCYSELGRDRGFDWRVVLGRACLLHEKIGERNHFTPDIL